MIEHELLFLGLLVEGPKHGYEIKRHIEEDLAPHVGLRIKSIYYPLKKLEEQGLIDKAIGREGRWPEKMVYKISAKGKKRFDNLIAQSFLSVDRPYFDIDLSIYFLPFIDRASAKRRLRGRVVLLRKILKQLESSKVANLGKPLGLILTHDCAMVQAEITSTEQLIQSL